MAVVITTTRLLSTTEVESVRAMLAVRMITSARHAGYDVLALDAESEPTLLDGIRKTGTHIVDQTGEGMGVARREAFAAAESNFPNSDTFIWLEPEKATMIQHLQAAARHIASGTDFVFFNRRSLESYPPEQAHAYALVRLAAQYILKLDLDFMFGPFAMSRAMIPHFVNYDGKYGDKWDSIHIPKLRAIRGGVSYKVMEIDYTHPREQTVVETGDMDLFMKRIEQAHLVAAAMCKECFI